MSNKRFTVNVLAVAGILLISLVAMQFTTMFYVIVGTLLLGIVIIIYELAMGWTDHAALRVAVYMATLGAVLHLQINRDTYYADIIGSENNPFNLIYLGVIATGALGALGARLFAGSVELLFPLAGVAPLRLNAAHPWWRHITTSSREGKRARSWVMYILIAMLIVGLSQAVLAGLIMWRIFF